MKSPRFHAAVAAALAASLFLAVEPPAAAARGRVQVAPAPAITVDVSRLRELGAGASADLVQRAMLSELASSGLARPGSRLVVRVIGLNINDYAGQTGGAGSGVGGGVNNDYLEAEAVLLGAGGQV
ncbi:MAG: hypothetical protein JO048_15450, partial [Methylobacteriaceae bacterium]|nr:hypothetical protein [Methylobacteriaceae bacterium]